MAIPNQNQTPTSFPSSSSPSSCSSSPPSSFSSSASLPSSSSTSSSSAVLYTAFASAPTPTPPLTSTASPASGSPKDPNPDTTPVALSVWMASATASGAGSSPDAATSFTAGALTRGWSRSPRALRAGHLFDSMLGLGLTLMSQDRMLVNFGRAPPTPMLSLCYYSLCIIIWVAGLSLRNQSSLLIGYNFW